MATRRWEHFPHGADVGVRGIGRSLEEAFEAAAEALTAIVVDSGTVAPLERVNVRCEASDDELLFVDWLNAILYEMAVRRMAFCRFEAHITGEKGLEGDAWGETIDPSRHKTGVEVKGATYTSLRVARRPDGTWFAQCIVDV